MNAPAETIREPRWPQPGELWSLWDIMQRFGAASFATAISQLHRAALIADTHDIKSQAERDMISGIVAETDVVLRMLPLRKSLRLQFERLKQSVETTGDGKEVRLRIAEFSNTLLTELTEACFFMIPTERREYYEQKRPPFGDAVAKRFGDAVKDISAASRCFALDEWTACVFHLMRVLELGLKALAHDVGLSVDAVKRENWKIIIDQIEKKIRDLEAEAKSEAKAQRTQALSAAATQFRYLKDAWRNHVTHAHSSYDEREATTIFNHVEAFMTQLAGLLPEEQRS